MTEVRKISLSALLSYIFIISNSIFSLIISPYVLKSVGDSAYGVYKTIGSMTSTMILLDLGMSGTIVRFSAKLFCENKIDEIKNFLSQMIIILLLLNVFIIAVGFLVYFFALPQYISGFSSYERGLARQIYVLMILELLLVNTSNFTAGFLAGSDNYVSVNGIKVFSIIAKIVLTYFILQLSRNIVLVVIIELVCLCIMIILDICFIFAKTHIKPKFMYWDFVLLKSVIAYSGLMFLQTIVDSINNNVDNIIIGKMCGPKQVSVYSFGLVLLHMLQQVSLAIASVMLPHIMKMTVDGASDEELQEIVIKAGRVQLIIVGGIISGFFLYGKSFVELWIGSTYSDVWLIAMILMSSALPPLVLNVAISVLRARNYMVFRSFALFLMALTNIFLTYFFVKRWGYIYASLGTAIGFILVNTIVMNIYYKYRLSFRPIYMLKKIAGRTPFCILLTIILSFCLTTKIHDGWLGVFLRIGLYVIIYAILIIFIGINSEERNKLFKISFFNKL